MIIANNFKGQKCSETTGIGGSTNREVRGLYQLAGTHSGGIFKREPHCPFCLSKDKEKTSEKSGEKKQDRQDDEITGVNSGGPG